jgi:transcriptional regulator with XRE-family HTH domain
MAVAVAVIPADDRQHGGSNEGAKAMYTDMKIIDPARVRALRDGKGWSQEWLAGAAGISVRTLQRVEADGSASRETLLCLAATLDCTPADLQPEVAPAPAPRRVVATEHVPADAPAYVRYGLLGVYTRRAALGFMWVSLALALAFLLAGLVQPRLLLGGVFAFSALWYWAALHWMDHRGQWPGAASGIAATEQATD